MDVVLTIVSLALILSACGLFTNSIERIGKKLNLHQGIIGSIFAAVGTALPETMIPIMAILVSSGEKADQVGIGAIAGAPFMLGTLAFFVTGLAVIIYSLLGKRSLKMNVDLDIFSKDLFFFMLIYGIAVLTTFLQSHIIIRTTIAVALMASYIIYIRLIVTEDGEQVEGVDPLYFSKAFMVNTSLFWILTQGFIALIGIVWGAHLFVKGVENLSVVLGISPLILSIIITPIATELPEKLNSIIWVGRGKDTLAIGNITGAMVFQSCFPVVFGILFTPWDLHGITMLSAILAFVSAALNLIWIKAKKEVNPFALLFGGVLYCLFIAYLWVFYLR
ncbi:MAG: sodium:calcium antiporter [Methylocystaceae bacterium]